MEQFKIEIFEKDHYGKKFPDFMIISEEEANNYYRQILLKFGMRDENLNRIELLQYIRNKSTYYYDINADKENFEFKKLLKKLNLVEPYEVNVNWYRFDKIERFNLIEFNKFFNYIWYPGPDDIDIFPDNLSWIISIDAMGGIYLLQ